MSKTIFVKPAVQGQKVHLEDKAKEFLPAEGADVPETVYWLRRLKDGSVVKAKRVKQSASS